LWFVSDKAGLFVDQTTLPALLLACLRVEYQVETYAQCAQLPAAAWAQLHALAVEQRVSSLLWQRLELHGLTTLIPAATRQAMQAQYYEFTVENLRLYHEVGQVLSRLRDQKIKVIVLKGAHLGAVIYANQALRLMNDVDLLFAQTDVPAVAALLASMGYQPDEEVVLERHFAAEHHLPRFAHAAHDATFEVHWRITYPDQASPLVMAVLWARAQPVTIAGVEVLALCPEDLLLHICEHATYHHLFAQGIRFLCDLDALIRRYAATLDWAAVQSRAAQWGWRRGVQLALTLAAQRLGTPVPPALLNQWPPAPVPDAVSDAVLAQALDQLFADQNTAELVSNEFAQLWSTPSLRQKVGLIWGRLFAPTLIIQEYPVKPDSCKLYFYYLVRCKDLLVRYGHTLWRLWRRDPLLTATTARKQQLSAWLAQR
jgi:Uncharacterised nucleotidyltransferase